MMLCPIAMMALMSFGVFRSWQNGRKQRYMGKKPKDKINPTVVLEVGGIQRGTTWKVGINGINRDGSFGPSNNNRSRVQQLGLNVKPWRSDGKYILICGQHDKSLQWQNMPP